MLMLAVSRKLIWVHEGVIARRWRGNDFNQAKLYELEDKTLGIVGLGDIGTKVARRAEALDMRVNYYDMNRIATDGRTRRRPLRAVARTVEDLGHRLAARAARQIDADLIGERELGLMKKTAILIDTCRGPVVDENALYKAVRDEPIVGPGLDVMVEEPPTPDHECSR